MDNVVDGHITLSLGRATAARFPLLPLLDALTEAGWTSYAVSDKWLKWSSVKAEGGDLARTTRELSHRLGVPRSSALSRVAAILIAFVDQTGPLDDLEYRLLEGLLLGERYGRRMAAKAAAA